MRCFYCINLVNPNIFYLNNNKNLETWRKETNENSRKLVPAKCETWFYLTYQSGENILKKLCVWVAQMCPDIRPLVSVLFSIIYS